MEFLSFCYVFPTCNLLICNLAYVSEVLTTSVIRATHRGATFQKKALFIFVDIGTRNLICNLNVCFREFCHNSVFFCYLYTVLHCIVTVLDDYIYIVYTVGHYVIVLIFLGTMNCTAAITLPSYTSAVLCYL